ncbi:MAG: hypothetical protein D6778_08205, partial [Nitrospirae bacterium]
FRPAFDYARADTEYKIHPNGVQACSTKDTLTLVSSLPFRFDEQRGEAEFHLKEGNILWFRLRYDEKTPERLEEHQAMVFYTGTALRTALLVRKGHFCSAPSG